MRSCSDLAISVARVRDRVHGGGGPDSVVMHGTRATSAASRIA